MENRRRLKGETTKSGEFRQLPEAEQDNKIARAPSTVLMEPAFIEMVRVKVRAISGHSSYDRMEKLAQAQSAVLMEPVFVEMVQNRVKAIAGD